jgi:hypothetical protein
MMTNKMAVVWSLFLGLALTLLAGCGSSGTFPNPPALLTGNVNLVFVVSQDVAYSATHKVLLGMTFQQNPLIVNALLASYFPNGDAPTAPVWAATDYDSLWTLTLDSSGNLTADFTQCEGINSATLPVTPPAF